MAEEKKKSTALTVISEENAEQYPILVNGEDLLETLTINIGRDGLHVKNLTRITVPGGGGLAWSYTDAGGNDEVAKELEGIIVHISEHRTFWKSRNLDGSPPDCFSDDMLYGIGDPGGKCGEPDHPGCCPYNEWKSAVAQDGSELAGKACSEKKRLYMLLPNAALPVVVEVPPTSLAALSNWKMNLPAPYYALVVGLSLVKGVSKSGGPDFAVIKPRVISRVSPEQKRVVMKYSQAIQDMLSNTSTRDEYDDDATEL